MAFYGDEDDLWKCPKHPSKRRRIGICPLCLRDRLVTLCPDCANVRPCNCCATTNTTTTSSSSSSSSSFSRFSSADLGSVGRLSNLIDGEPAFRRSRSLAAIPFLRSRFVADSVDDCSSSGNNSARTSSFWSIFRSKSKKRNDGGEIDFRRRAKEVAEVEEAMRRKLMIRSRSVAVADSGGRIVRPPVKPRTWYFPSPIKAFRQTKISKPVLTERSPLHRG
ncbi:hypothetical protein IC582_015023 [Cucumis melo]|uniref:Uncharacterized protein LOC103503260 n=2 Tax=Cucumis melo TaxID=3656 RepID=A0A1S3CQR3_CUCME|nr:uncharacterized protein LOC103503260 [Cucumis melo]KAA0053035.1 uncharacterized protein E6C27_scaffold344G001500 [Cucumis melo var. makuwa]TYK11490.1 uncharacterized protein E5676_scaffold139G001530 [Cucumis melo var. makuwa]